MSENTSDSKRRIRAHRLRTPLLRMLSCLFTYLGVQFEPIDWWRPSSLLHLLWNIAFNALLIDSMLKFATFHPIRKFCNTTKPLFAFFVSLCQDYIYPVSTSINCVYFAVWFHRVVRLLDRDCLRRYYRSKRVAKIITLTIALLFHGTLVVIIVAMRTIFVTDRSSASIEWRRSHMILCVYMLNAHQFGIIATYHYYQRATDLALRRIEHELLLDQQQQQSRRRQIRFRISQQQQNEIHLRAKVAAEIVELASVNRSLSRHLAIPLLFCLVHNFLNLILTICITIICSPFWPIFAQSICMWMYMAFVVTRNARIRRTFARICDHISDAKRFDDNPDEDDAENDPHYHQHHEAYHHHEDDLDSVLDQSRSTQDISIDHRRRFIRRMTQFDIYAQCFAIDMANFGSLRLPLLFSILSFGLNYIVLMSQTN